MSVLERFDESIAGLSETTQQRYLQVVKGFIRAVGLKRRYRKEDVLQYLAQLEKRGCGNNHRRWVFTVLHTFYETMGWDWWTRREQRRVMPKAEDPKMPYLRQPELGQVLEALASKPPMVQALFRIAELTPIRRIELQRLDREDYQRPYLRIKTRKGGEARTLTLDEQTCNLLEEYLAARRDVDPALFVSTLNKRIALITLTLLFRRTLVELGLYRRGLGWHGARRGVTTMLHRAGASERELQELGGWRSPFMPHRYIQLEPTEVDEKAKRIHPLIKRT